MKYLLGAGAGAVVAILYCVIAKPWFDLNEFKSLSHTEAPKEVSKCVKADGSTLYGSPPFTEKCVQILPVKGNVTTVHFEKVPEPTKTETKGRTVMGINKELNCEYPEKCKEMIQQYREEL